MDFKLLTYFLKVYEKRGLRQAAADLFISPQGLSRSIQNLESDLNVILFERTVKGLEPTKAADYLYKYALETLGDFRKLYEELQIISENKKDVSFVCSYGVMNALPYDRFLEFQNQHMDWNISWREFPDQYAVQELYKENYEFGLLVIDPAQVEENYHVEFLFEKNMMVLVYEGHPLYEKQIIDYEDLRDERIIMEGKDFWIYHSFKENCIAQGFCPDIMIETGDISFCHKLCSMRQGIGVTVDFIADFIQKENVRAIPFSDDSFLWKVYLVYNSRRMISPSAQNLIAYFKEKSVK